MCRPERWNRESGNQVLHQRRWLYIECSARDSSSLFFGFFMISLCKLPICVLLSGFHISGIDEGPSMLQTLKSFPKKANADNI